MKSRPTKQQSGKPRQEPKRAPAVKRAAPAPDLTNGSANGDTFVLSLYVTGNTPRSLRAIENITRICEQRLKNQYTLRVVDLYQHPQLAAGESIIAAPTLIKHLPGPLRRLVGDMTNEERVLVGLNIAGSSM